LYTAVIVPVAVSWAVVRVAVDSSNPFASPPEIADTGTAVPICIVPEKKVTVPEGGRPWLPPVGFAELCVSMNAVSVKFVFGATEVTLEWTVVVVGPDVTVSEPVAGVVVKA
jgi:hypothetical protein